jgi:hypothetical protein
MPQLLSAGFVPAPRTLFVVAIVGALANVQQPLPTTTTPSSRAENAQLPAQMRAIVNALAGTWFDHGGTFVGRIANESSKQQIAGLRCFPIEGVHILGSRVAEQQQRIIRS